MRYFVALHAFPFVLAHLLTVLVLNTVFEPMLEGIHINVFEQWPKPRPMRLG